MTDIPLPPLRASREIRGDSEDQNPRSEPQPFVNGDFADYLLSLGHRHNTIRSGEREPIPWHIRLAVYMRDGNRCRSCGTYARHSTKNLDHVYPWSAGGSDHSDNLRTLCPPCNQERSNYRDGADQTRVLPVTWWCLDCWTSADLHRWLHAETGSSCISLRFWPEWSTHPFLDHDEPLTLAYCAHCDSTGYTTDPL